MYPKDYLEILNEICNNHSIILKEFPDTSIMCLTKGNQQHFIWSRRFDLNSAISVRIADNKYETYVVLNDANIPTVEHKKLFRIGSEEYNISSACNYEICSSYLKTHESVVIKPNNSYEGNDVYKCSSLREIEHAISQLGQRYKFFVVTPYIPASAEYRCIYLNGQILFIYKKNLPYIITDGKSTVYELLTQKKYEIKHVSSNLLEHIDTIYPANQTIYLNWKFNLSQGAYCSIVSDLQLRSSLRNLAARAASAINIAFASIDILADNQGQYKILEINAGVAMDQFIQQQPNGKKIAAAIYEKAVLAMFEESSDIIR